MRAGKSTPLARAVIGIDTLPVNAALAQHGAQLLHLTLAFKYGGYSSEVERSAERLSGSESAPDI